MNDNTKTLRLNLRYEVEMDATVIATVPADITPAEIRALADPLYGVVDWEEVETNDLEVNETYEAPGEDPDVTVRRGPDGSLTVFGKEQWELLRRHGRGERNLFYAEGRRKGQKFDPRDVRATLVVRVPADATPVARRED
jgi:hypothetical protein